MRAGVAEKERKVEELMEKLGQAQCSILTDYRGLTVAEITKLRNRLREQGVEYRVVKNTLARRAVDRLGFQEVIDYLVGPTAIAMSQDPVAPAKEITAFAKEYKNLEVKAGILEGKIIDPAAIKYLAELPSREELLAKVAGSFIAPVQTFASLLQAPVRQLALLVDALKARREVEQGA